MPVFKLHGSVNWLPVPGAATGVDLAMVEEESRARPTSIVKSGPLVSSQSWATYVPPNRRSLFVELERHRTYVPVAAVYGSGKNLLNNPQHVESHRNACFDRLCAAPPAHVVALGLRPVSDEDDPVVGRLLDQLSEGSGEKIYVSPSKEECEAFGRRGFRPVAGTLADFLSKASKRYTEEGEPQP